MSGEDKQTRTVINTDIFVENSTGKKRRTTIETVTKRSSLTKELTDLLNDSYDTYNHDEIFDINPKTDYTYAKSGSYSPRYNGKECVSPNMSRRRLTAKVSNVEFSDNETDDLFDQTDNMYAQTDNAYEETHEIYSQKDNRYEEYSDYSDEDDSVDSAGFEYRRRTVDGMVLRSGKSLHSVEKALMEKESNRNQNRYSLGSSTKLGQSYIQNVSHYPTGLNQNARTSSSRYSMSTVRKTLTEFSDDEDEKGALDSMSKEDVSSVSLTTEGSAHAVNHLYGLEPDEEGVSDSAYSESKSSSSTSKSSGFSKVSRKKPPIAEKTLTTTVITTVTTVIETITSLSKPLVAPVWTAVGQPAASLLSPLFSYLLSRFYSFISYFLMVDVWLLARSKRTACCLCLPLLLLLPLLLTSAAWYASSDSNAVGGSISSLGYYLIPFYWFTKEKDTSSIYQNQQYTSVININEHVQKIVLELQKKQGNMLTEADVEIIARRIMQNALREELLVVSQQLSEKNENIVKLMNTDAEHGKEFSNIMLQIQSMKQLIEDQAKELELARSQIESHGGTLMDISGTLAKIGLLEDQLAALKTDYLKLDLSQQAFSLSLKNCCKDESYIRMMISSQVKQILSELIEDGKGGFGGNTLSDELLMWLNSQYVSRSELDKLLAALGHNVTEKIIALIPKDTEKQQVIIQSSESGLGDDYIKLLVENALLEYSADKTGLADFALESAGGSVISTRCSETYYRKTALVSIFGIPLWYSSNSPRTVIQPDVHPGQCWAFRGTQGYLVIELSTFVTPTGFSLEHIPKSLSPTGKTTSAPKDFTVLGLKDEKDSEGFAFGNFSYDNEGKPIQFFNVQASDVRPYKLIELRVLSNHGNAEYTCLYRFRVHGHQNND